MNPTIHITILRRDGPLFDGDAEALSSINDIGAFDILPQHSNFVGIVNKYVRIHKQGGGIEEIPIDRGILRVKENKVEVYVGY